jgi:hypothetical protein
MKAHEKILTELEGSFLALPEGARAEVCQRIAPALSALNKTLGGLDKKHPELAEQVKRLITPILKTVAASFFPGGTPLAQVVDGITARAPDLAPTLFRAIQDARK